MRNGLYAKVESHYPLAKLYKGTVPPGEITHWSENGENIEDPDWDLIEVVKDAVTDKDKSEG